MAQLKNTLVDDIFDFGKDIEDTLTSVDSIYRGEYPDVVVNQIKAAVGELEKARNKLWVVLADRGMSASQIADHAATDVEIVNIALLSGRMTRQGRVNG